MIQFKAPRAQLGEKQTVNIQNNLKNCMIKHKL